MISFEIIQEALYVAAFLLGVKFFMLKNSPLYFRLLFYGVACFMLEELYYLVDYTCTGSWPESFSFAAFGASAGFAFMLSANYGQFDGFVDDGSEGCIKARKIGFAAPCVLAVIFIISTSYFIKTTGNIVYAVLTAVCQLPAFFASYFHLKHLLLPDVMHFMVDPLRPLNAVCLLLILIDILADAFFAFGYRTAYSVCGVVVAALFVLMMITAEKGHREWKI